MIINDKEHEDLIKRIADLVLPKFHSFMIIAEGDPVGMLSTCGELGPDKLLMMMAVAAEKNMSFQAAVIALSGRFLGLTDEQVKYFYEKAARDRRHQESLAKDKEDLIRKFKENKQVNNN
jgi:hypothetical protein